MKADQRSQRRAGWWGVVEGEGRERESVCGGKEEE